MKFDDITITIRDAGESDATISVKFNPEAPVNTDEVEDSPSLTLLSVILDALAVDENLTQEENRSVH